MTTTNSLTDEDLRRWEQVRADFLAAVDDFLARGGTTARAAAILVRLSREWRQAAAAKGGVSHAS